MNHVAEPLLRSFNSTITLFLCPFLLPVGVGGAGWAAGAERKMDRDDWQR
jgi:hypothetical protein